MKKFVFSVDVELDFYPKGGVNGLTEGVPLILSLLKKFDIRATFFVTAEVVEKFPEVIKNLGKTHEIACHSYMHENMSKLSQSEQYRVLKKATEIIETVAKRPVGFRAPRLNVDENLFKNLEKLGYVYDSSIPEFGLKRFKYSKRFDTGEIIELRPIPSYILRINESVFRAVLRRSFKKNGYAVFFTHPWEAIEFPFTKKEFFNLRLMAFFHNYFRTGEIFMNKLRRLFENLSINQEFTTARQLAAVL